MRALSQADVLNLWEVGRSRHPLDQGVLALEAVTDASRQAIADWPIGRRNHALAQLHGMMFGDWLRGWTTCQDCSEQLEFALDCGALADGAPPDPEDTVDVDGEAFRLPTSRDLAAAASAGEPAVAARRLLALCRLTPDEGASDWSDEVVETIGERLAAADPLAEILLGFECPSCGAAFAESLDLAAFLWSELEGRARATLAEVHVLAHAYGWTETAVLALTPARRALYLEMVQG
jgi:hypothetical protein